MNVTGYGEVRSPGLLLAEQLQPEDVWILNKGYAAAPYNHAWIGLEQILCSPPELHKKEALALAKEPFMAIAQTSGGYQFSAQIVVDCWPVFVHRVWQGFYNWNIYRRAHLSLCATAANIAEHFEEDRPLHPQHVGDFYQAVVMAVGASAGRKGFIFPGSVREEAAPRPEDLRKYNFNHDGYRLAVENGQPGKYPPIQLKGTRVTKSKAFRKGKPAPEICSIHVRPILTRRAELLIGRENRNRDLEKFLTEERKMRLFKAIGGMLRTKSEKVELSVPQQQYFEGLRSDIESQMHTFVTRRLSIKDAN